MKYLSGWIFILILSGCANQHLVNAKQHINNVKTAKKTASMAHSMSPDSQAFIKHKMLLIECWDLKMAESELKKVTKNDLNNLELNDYMQIEKEITALKKTTYKCTSD